MGLFVLFERTVWCVMVVLSGYCSVRWMFVSSAFHTRSIDTTAMCLQASYNAHSHWQCTGTRSAVSRSYEIVDDVSPALQHYKRC